LFIFLPKLNAIINGGNVYIIIDFSFILSGTYSLLKEPILSLYIVVFISGFLHHVPLFCPETSLEILNHENGTLSLV
jgi:hypothetical protein